MSQTKTRKITFSKKTVTVFNQRPQTVRFTADIFIHTTQGTVVTNPTNGTISSSNLFEL